MHMGVILCLVGSCLIVSIVAGMALLVRGGYLDRRRREILHVDFIEASRHQSVEDRLRFLRRKYREQDLLLRWRISRFLDALAYDADQDLISVISAGRRMVGDRDVFLDGRIEKRRRFSFFFPILRTVSIQTEICFFSPTTKEIVVISDPPAELVHDIWNMQRARIGLGYFH